LLKQEQTRALLCKRKTEIKLIMQMKLQNAAEKNVIMAFKRKNVALRKYNLL
jgi:hypothetical protein